MGARVARVACIATILGAAAGPVPSARADRVQAAAGAGLGWQHRKDFGEASRENLVLELIGLGYVPLPYRRLYARPGARFGYSGLEQAPQPMGISLEERDLSMSAEAGVVYDGVAIPSLTIGGGLVLRRIALVTDGVTGDSLDRNETLPMLYVQAGLGLSFARGLLVVEPQLRYERVHRDERLHWRYGVELTVRVR
jgi:hypothetical protein